MFEREFHILSSLSHPSIIEVYDYGVDETGAYYMTLPEGTYLVAFYYVDTTVEYAGIEVAAHKVTPLFSRLALEEPSRLRLEPEAITITDIKVTHEYESQDLYPSEVLEPEPGITFSGETAQESEYYE